jgi:hypothetical protein
METLSRLEERLRQFAPMPADKDKARRDEFEYTVDAELAGGHSLSRLPLTELGKDTLYDAFAINKLSMHAGPNALWLADLEFSATERAFLRVEGDRVACEACISDVDRILSGVGMWYGDLYNWLIAGLAIVLTILFAYMLERAWWGVSVINSILAFISFFLPVLLAVTFLFMWLFHRAEFLIGKGTNDANWRASAHTLVFVVFGLGSLLAVFNQFILRWLNLA